MISRTVIGRSFGGLARYLVEGHKGQEADKQAELLGSAGVRTDTVAHMIADFNLGRKLHPELGKAVWHTSLSFNPDDAAKLTGEKMREIAEDYMQEMKLTGTQYAIIRHRDRPGHEHVHIIANRVADDGHTISDSNSFLRSKEALSKLIQRHELTPPQGLRVEKQHPTHLERDELAKHEIKQALRQALTTATNRPALLATLRAEKITVQEYATKAGIVVGIGFEKDGYAFKGSAVAREYSLAGLDKQLAANQVRQQAEREHQAVAQAQRQAAAQLAQRQEAERQAVQLAQRQEAAQRATQEAQRQETLRQAAVQAAKGPELPAVERKWQADYQRYTTQVAQQNAPIRARNEQVTAHSSYLKAHPDDAGLQVVLGQLGAAGANGLKAELERQAKELASHARNVEMTYGQEEALKKQAKGVLGFGFGAKAKEAAEKLEILANEGRYIPDDKNRMFAIYTALAAKPALVPGFEARTYQQPEVVVLSLAAYAAQREAERQAVVRMSQSADEARTAGRAEALQRALDSHGAKTQLTHRLDAQGNRVSELVVQYSLQSHELQKVSRTLDWAQGREGYEVQEQAADRAQRQALDQREAQQRPRQEKSQGYGGQGI
jgi:hypothetical protein